MKSKSILVLLSVLFLTPGGWAATLDRSKPNVYGNPATSEWNLGNSGVKIDNQVKKDGAAS